MSEAAYGLTKAGVIVKVPSATLLAGPILAPTAFARIGTNDLIQYVMAADRDHGVRGAHDTLNMSIPRLVATLCDA